MNEADGRMPARMIVATKDGSPVTWKTGDVAAEDVEWYWDLERGIAVTADERGPGDRTLGPYASRAEAQHWKSRVESRNQSWDDADDEWEAGPDERDR